MPGRDSTARCLSALVRCASIASLGLPHLELIGGLTKSPPGDPNYFPRNRHFTPRGHRLIAEALARFLEREGLLE